MSVIQVWHNPRCTKSRAAISLLEQRGLKPSIRLYLEEPPDAELIDEVLKKLGKEPRELMRKSEDVYKELKLDDPKKSRAQLIEAMAENPILIERPVAIRGDRAVIGRPPENVLELVEEE
jgi:arsenate reductase